MKTILKESVLVLVMAFTFFIGVGWAETIKKLKPFNPIPIKPSQSIQVNKSRDYLLKLYIDSNNQNTFYCGCFLNSKLHINKE